MQLWCRCLLQLGLGTRWVPSHQYVVMKAVVEKNRATRFRPTDSSARHFRVVFMISKRAAASPQAARKFIQEGEWRSEEEEGEERHGAARRGRTENYARLLCLFSPPGASLSSERREVTGGPDSKFRSSIYFRFTAETVQPQREDGELRHRRRAGRQLRRRDAESGAPLSLLVTLPACASSLWPDCSYWEKSPRQLTPQPRPLF